jgi:hypothetical protein
MEKDQKIKILEENKKSISELEVYLWKNIIEKCKGASWDFKNTCNSLIADFYKK